MKTFRVEIVEIKTGKVVSVIGKGLSLKQADKREETGVMRVDLEHFFVRTVLEEI